MFALPCQNSFYGFSTLIGFVEAESSDLDFLQGKAARHPPQANRMLNTDVWRLRRGKAKPNGSFPAFYRGLIKDKVFQFFQD